MKRSRRVVLTMMGNAAAGAVSIGWIGAPNCGRNEVLVTGPEGGRPYCRARGGFGVTTETIYPTKPRPVQGGTVTVHTVPVRSGHVHRGGGGVIHFGG